MGMISRRIQPNSIISNTEQSIPNEGTNVIDLACEEESGTSSFKAPELSVIQPTDQNSTSSFISATIFILVTCYLEPFYILCVFT